MTWIYIFFTHWPLEIFFERHLRVVEPFTCHWLATKSLKCPKVHLYCHVGWALTICNLLFQMQSIRFRSSAMHRKQNFLIVFGLISDTVLLTFKFYSLFFPLLSLFNLVPFVFTFAGHLPGFIPVRKVSDKAFRILGWDGWKLLQVGGSGARSLFSLEFLGHLFMLFVLIFSGLSDWIFYQSFYSLGQKQLSHFHWMPFFFSFGLSPRLSNVVYCS